MKIVFLYLVHPSCLDLIVVVPAKEQDQFCLTLQQTQHGATQEETEIIRQPKEEGWLTLERIISQLISDPLN